MEIQLTKNKKITIGGPRGGSGGKSSGTRGTKGVDIVGIDLYSGDPRGCPAIRLREKKGALRIVAMGFVQEPSSPLPSSWDAASKPCAWSLPTPLQAPNAALSVTSSDMFFAQVANENQSATGEKPGVPFSKDGTRHVILPMEAAKGFTLSAALPEYQTLWLSRLLPEGRRPTTSSIQLRPAALTAALSRQPGFKDPDSAALALFFVGNGVFIAGYNEGKLALWRQCRGVPGYPAIRKAMQDGLGLEDSMVDNVLNENLIDPRSVLEPVIAPILNELSVSRDYIVGKLGGKLRQTYVVGFGAGAVRFAEITSERLHVKTIIPDILAGLAGAPSEFAHESALLGALGAALAAIDGTANLLKESEILSSSPVRIRVMAPVLAILASLAMLVWWGVLFGQLMLAKAELTSTNDDLEQRQKAHEQVTVRMKEANELEDELEQLSYYSAGCNKWSGALTSLAEVMPIKIQLVRLEIPAPPAQDLANPKGPKYPPLWGPTSSVERVTMILAGRTTKDTPVTSLMDSLASEAFTNTLRIVKDQSPKVHSFKQETAVKDGDRRMLAFEIEYLARERRFSK